MAVHERFGLLQRTMSVASMSVAQGACGHPDANFDEAWWE